MIPTRPLLQPGFRRFGAVRTTYPPAQRTRHHRPGARHRGDHRLDHRDRWRRAGDRRHRARFIGRSRAKKGQATNGGVALAGIITGAIGLVLSIVLVVAGAALFFGSGGSTS